MPAILTYCNPLRRSPRKRNASITTNTIGRLLNGGEVVEISPCLKTLIERRKVYAFSALVMNRSSSCHIVSLKSAIGTNGRNTNESNAIRGVTEALNAVACSCLSEFFSMTAATPMQTEEISIR